MNQKTIKGAHTSHLPPPTSQKGITLIALVITIIVLLILAGVTINMVLGDEGVIGQTQSAKDAQENAEGRDKGAISQAEGVLSRYSMGKYDDTLKPIAKQNSTINGEKASADNPVIPKGFKHLTGTVDTGFVIQDEAGNEFVWIPVNGTTIKLELDNNLRTRIGREPDLVTGGTDIEEDEEGNQFEVTDLNRNTYDGNKENRKAILDSGYDNTNLGLKQQFQDEFNAMVESVKIYGGFYVGRYETSWTGSKVASVVGATPIKQEGKNEVFTAKTDLGTGWTTELTGDTKNQATWYGLYKYQKELYKKNSSSSVVSGMIYGCQWDAIMNWMLSDNDTEDFVRNSSGQGVYSETEPLQTGQYQVNNIYDLAGNYVEWTQEVSRYN